MGVENQATLGIGTALGHASHCSAVIGEEGRRGEVNGGEEWGRTERGRDQVGEGTRWEVKLGGERKMRRGREGAEGVEEQREVSPALAT